MVLHIPLLVDAVVLSLWPDSKAREFHCGGITVCVPFERDICQGPWQVIPPSAAQEVAGVGICPSWE